VPRRLFHDKQLELMRMETKLVEALFEHPGVLARRQEHELRYALGLAQVHTFQPGAARVGMRTARPDVDVRDAELAHFRHLVLEHLSPVLIHTRHERQRLERIAAAFGRVRPHMASTRRAVLAAHVNDFSESELDEEVGQKTLVSVAGGGGGSGYVYIGAWHVLQNAGLVPGYVLGSSVGAVLGLFRALKRKGDFEEYMAFGKGVRFDELFRFVSVKARYGLPGVLRMFLHAAIGARFRHPDGSNMRLSDLEIPFEAIVGGVRRGALEETPEQYAASHHLPEDRRPGPLQWRAQVAAQLVRMVGFFNPLMVREIVIGDSALTREFDCVDAAGFSGAVPGVIHYDVSRPDPHMHALLEQLLHEEDVVALVDGGVANNLPSNTAFRRVQEGVVGTRNCFYLGFDSLHPQTSFGHIWLHPIERIVALQVALNERYTQRHLRFPKTLSPINVLPRDDQMERAVRWGREHMTRELPLVKKFFEKVPWIEP
jgi:predicted acylesterase/phospholipase RssA